MPVLSRFGTQTLKINIADNIQDGVAGVMGDFNSRGLNVTITAENGEVLEDPSITIKLLCKTEAEQLIFVNGEYIGEGIYHVNFPNEVFEQEQELDCIIQLTKEEEIIYSRIFKRRVAKGLLGTEREGTSTIIDLLKIMDFADHYQEKLKEMEDLGNKEEAEIIAKALELTENFNANATEKTEAFNTNAIEKTDAFNANAAEKTDIVNNIKEEVESLKNITVAAKDTTLDTKKIFDGEYTDFNNRYSEVQGILEAEEDRVEAEEKRQDFDERLQKIFDDGLEAELGNYYTKPETEAELEKKSDVGHNHMDTWRNVQDYGTLKKEEPYFQICTFTRTKGDGTIEFKMQRGLSQSVKLYLRLGYGTDKFGECTSTGSTNIWIAPTENEREFALISDRSAKWWDRKFEYTVVDWQTLTPNVNVDLTQWKTVMELPEGAKKFVKEDEATRTELRALRTDLEEESASNREEFSKINTALEEHTKVLAEILEIARDTNKKIDDSNRNYKALLKSDKDLIG